MDAKAALSEFLVRYPSKNNIEDPFLIIPTFNNGAYVKNFIAQLKALGLNRYLLLDGGSDDPDTVVMLTNLSKEGASPFPFRCALSQDKLRLTLTI